MIKKWLARRFSNEYRGYELFTGLQVTVMVTGTLLFVVILPFQGFLAFTIALATLLSLTGLMRS